MAFFVAAFIWPVPSDTLFVACRLLRVPEADFLPVVRQTRLSALPPSF